jgi:molybdopterin/thiamine biosynthesis adenylyltransferase/rhodanese-related sulfurtransferase
VLYQWEELDLSTAIQVATEIFAPEIAASVVMTELSREELERYGRHLVMPEISLAGQQQLKRARVLCVGAGGLGSPVALYLAAAGVGTLGLAEDDTVDLSNIQRQILYDSADVGRPKLDAAAARLRQLNPHTEVISHALRLTADNVMAILDSYDIVVDGSDNFATRYLVNDAAVLAGKPDVHASVYRFEGQVSVFDAARGPCYSCLFPEPPPAGLVPSCAQGGVLGMLPGIIGSLQALEVVKLIVGCGQPLIGRLLSFDGLSGTFRELQLEKDPGCAVCGVDASLTAPRRQIAPAPHACAVGDGDQAADAIATTTVEELASRLHVDPLLTLLDVRDPGEVALAQIPGATLIPLGELPMRLGELDQNRRYVVTCHRGPRSLRACALLREAGFDQVQSLEGGIDAWAQRIDPTLLRY